MQKIWNGWIKCIWKLGMCCVAVLAAITFEQSIPDQIYVAIGNEVSYDFGVPVSVVLKKDEEEVFDNFAHTVAAIEQENPIAYTVTCKLFGIIPVKDVEVTLVDEDLVYTGGCPIGIYVETKGILVIGTGTLTTSDGQVIEPAQHIVKAGDYIESVNGEEVTSKEDLIEKINQYGTQKEILGIRREEQHIEVAITPVKVESGDYKIGVWVRDDLAGVGTLTYFTAEGAYGALGHGVSDADTGLLMDIEDGWIYETNIVGIKRGEDGTPGELSGVIEYGTNSRLGSISENKTIGIHGLLDGNINALGTSNCVEIAYKQDIEYGEAYLISGISGENKAYQINIEKIDYSENEENKGILFEVTDEELLALTGGIVQGMSGSPIIQDGRLIGAVTHVFISDASKGYGIFIEKMLEE